MLDAAAYPSLPDFDIQRCLARGGMAEVFLARVVEGGLRDTDVILKRLHPLHRHDEAYVDLFVAEARLGELIVHPNIAQTYELLHRDEEVFIVQELVEGCTLADLVFLGDVPREALFAAFDDLLQALEHLHAGANLPGGAAIIHRDVNPSNIVVRMDGVAKLIDFGIAEVEGKPDHERTGALAGTAAYMSPEQAKGLVLDRRSDVFSAGIILWELLMGVSLFRRGTEFETLRAVCEDHVPQLTPLKPDLRAAFERVLDKAMARDPEDRYASAAELLNDFESACARVGAEFDRAALTAAVYRVTAGRTDDPRSAA